ncbi:MAG: DUF4870 domain-containing protein [Acidobacteriota bacterium]|jgi:uncharacterized membrane protein
MEPTKEACAGLEGVPEDEAAAGLVYLSFMVGQVIVPAVLYYLFRKRSPFLRFHVLQCLFSQVLLAGALALFAMGMGAMTFLGVMASALRHFAGPPTFLLVFPSFFIFLMLWWLAAIALCLLGLFNILSGRDFRIPFLGNYLAQEIFSEFPPENPGTQSGSESALEASPA